MTLLGSVMFETNAIARGDQCLEKSRIQNIIYGLSHFPTKENAKHCEREEKEMFRNSSRSSRFNSRDYELIACISLISPGPSGEMVGPEYFVKH
jgi:hypothetical protein